MQAVRPSENNSSDEGKHVPGFGSKYVRVHIVDAFTDKPFAGNPAGVVLLTEDTWAGPGWPPDDLMRNIAAELGHETAFARPWSGDDSADWSLRWFTPTAESNVCGHATLATIHILRLQYGAPVSVTFTSSFGYLDGRADQEGPITLDFPAAVLTQAAVPDGLAAALRTEPGDATLTGTLGDLIVSVDDEATVRDLRPDIGALAEVIEHNDLRGVIVTAPARRQGGAYDFISRFFAPAATGMPEDPVTGSAHTALAPFWSVRLGKAELSGLQASQRTGLVHVALRDDRVLLSGDAVTAFEGLIHLP